MIEKLKINSIHDGLPLDILIATCNNPKAIVQIVHGMCEYKERYLDCLLYTSNRAVSKLPIKMRFPLRKMAAGVTSTGICSTCGL